MLPIPLIPPILEIGLIPPMELIALSLLPLLIGFISLTLKSGSPSIPWILPNMEGGGGCCCCCCCCCCCGGCCAWLSIGNVFGRDERSIIGCSCCCPWFSCFVGEWKRSSVCGSDFAISWISVSKIECCIVALKIEFELDGGEEVSIDITDGFVFGVAGECCGGDEIKGRLFWLIGCDCEFIKF